MRKVAVLDKDESRVEGMTVHEAIWDIDHIEGYRYELHEGALRVSPSPGFSHQRIARRLMKHFEAQGREAVHELSVIFDNHNFRNPDVLRLRPDAEPPGEGLVPPLFFDLFVEIVSRTTRDEDRIIKPKVYAQAGIPEYWRVEPEADGYVVYMHRLEGGRYVQTRVVPIEELLAEG
ncbi:Uma2 family endonuclease [Dactylosporangium sp. CA-139114]|uniref:Uma2 family endonuclease n=1 Tax=Dactylosporangium sp. CA-139114 TaxID=3239931 RepID=UPI003D959866